MLADQPKDREIHLILDNYVPSSKRNDDWLAKFEGRSPVSLHADFGKLAEPD